MGTECEPKMGTEYEPKMGTDYEPKMGTKYEPKMGTQTCSFLIYFVQRLAKTQAGPHLHAGSLYTNHAPSLDRNPSPHPHTMLLSGEHGLAPRAGSPGC